MLGSMLVISVIFLWGGLFWRQTSCLLSPRNRQDWRASCCRLEMNNWIPVIPPAFSFSVPALNVRFPGAGLWRKMQVSAIVYHEHGNPAEVVRVEQQELPEIKPGDVRIRILAAPINPADLNMIEGKYPILQALLAVPGMEGAGVVEAAGKEVTHLNIGDQVLLPHGVGTWREACVCAAHGVVAVPEGIEPAQAAMLKINPATAWRMLHDFAELKPGDWVIQNAANSGVGRAVIQIAKDLGLHTVNIVRRESLAAELEAIGADAVLMDTADFRKEKCPPAQAERRSSSR